MSRALGLALLLVVVATGCRTDALTAAEAAALHDLRWKVQATPAPPEAADEAPPAAEQDRAEAVAAPSDDGDAPGGTP